LNPWRSLWSAITHNRLVAVVVAIVVLIAVYGLVERVMTHGYGVLVQWSQNGRIELTPPPTPAASGPAMR
jgi:hypothetical protein